MNVRLRGGLDRLRLWLGQRSRREILLLWAFWIAILGYAFSQVLLLPSVTTLRREQTRYRASQTSLHSLETTLSARDEIMARAERLVYDYLQWRRLDPSTLVLERVDREQGDVQLISIYPSGAAQTGQGSRFRVQLAGSAGGLARMFFRLETGAPPVLVRELVLSPQTGTADRLMAGAVLEVNGAALPADWERLFAHWRVGSHPEARPPEVADSSSAQTGPPRPTLLSRAAPRLQSGWHHFAAKVQARVPSWLRFRSAPRIERPARGAATRGPDSGTAAAEFAGDSLTAALRGLPIANAAPIVPVFPYSSLDRSGLFRPAVSADQTQWMGTAAPTIQTILQNLSLTAVIWQKPPVAIIRDKTTGQANYRRTGEFIGELKVVEIGKRFVILRYKEEEGRLE
jgi:hypothetical protein